MLAKKTSPFVSVFKNALSFLMVAAVIFLIAIEVHYQAKDRVFWQEHFKNINDFSKDCRVGVGEWQSDFKKALLHNTPLSIKTIPFRGLKDPPRAYLNQFLKIVCSIEFTQFECFLWVSFGPVFGNSKTYVNGIPRTKKRERAM